MIAMNLKGGVVIVGSLIWEDHLDFETEGENFVRRYWRDQNLLPERMPTPMPIRYGRESKTNRKGTYSMILSKGCENTLGQGLILQFKELINTFEGLERQAIALAIAEGIYRPDKPDKKRLSCKWGSVGLLINPALRSSDFAKFEFLHKRWSDIYRSYGDRFSATKYLCDGDTEPPIDANGMLTINWQESMSDFDVLLATPVVPIPTRMLEPKEIAERINEKTYDTYFKSNLANSITTFQDAQISKLLPNN